jgi:hypothetical protein
MKKKQVKRHAFGKKLYACHIFAPVYMHMQVYCYEKQGKLLERSDLKLDRSVCLSLVIQTSSVNDIIHLFQLDVGYA